MDYAGMFEAHDAQRDKRLRNGVYLAEILCDYIQPKSVIDLGCGLGFFLAAMQAKGAEVTAVDGDWVSPLKTEVDKSRYRVADLDQPFADSRRYDLAASIEVAEHLRPARSAAFVAELCALSDMVLFSAGVPGQGGAGHINLRFQDEWAAMFAEQGYDCYDPIRRRIAAHEDVFNWFTMNTLLYIKTGTPVSDRLAEHRIPIAAAAIVSKNFHANRVKVFKKRVAKLREAGAGAAT